MKNLFIIGAQRSGSTLLAKTLDLHSKIKLMTPIKPEPKYFLGTIIAANKFTLIFLKDMKKIITIFLKSVSYIEHEEH